MIKKIVFYFTVLFFLTACGARTSIAVKDDNLLNIFNANMSYEDASNIIYDMSRYCKSGLYTLERENFASLKKSTISMKLNGNMPGYYMLIESEKVNDTTSKISVYHYYNFENTRKMAKTIEEWVNNNSKVCIPGF